MGFVDNPSEGSCPVAAEVTLYLLWKQYSFVTVRSAVLKVLRLSM